MFNNLFDIRKIAKMSYGTQAKPRLTGLGSLAIGQVEFPNLELSRTSRRFVGGNQVIANGFAPSTTIPTTTGNATLFNGEAAGGKIYALDYVNYWLGSGTAAAGATIMAGVTRGTITAPTAATNWSSIGLNPNATTKAIWATNPTLTVGGLNPVWIGLTGSQQAAAANVGQGVNGQPLPWPFLIPPGYAIAFAVFSGAGTTPLYGISVSWAELEIDLE
jgi:hypothetical protein